MQRFFVISFLFFFVLGPVLGANEPREINTRVREVTIYRSGAELVHEARTGLPQGNIELIFTNLSNAIDLSSLQVSCPAGVTLLSVEFTTNHLIQPESSRRIAYLKDSVGRMDRFILDRKVNMQVTMDLLEVLRSNHEIRGEQNGLSVAELARLMDYYSAKMKELQTTYESLKVGIDSLQKQKQLLESQIREEETKNTKTQGQLHLNLSVALADTYDFSISYITPNAHWVPYYDLVVNKVNAPMKVVYKAKMVQSTGLDWKKVKLSLSSSLPGQWGVAPLLQTWFLSYINPVAVMEKRLTTENTIQNYTNTLSGKVAGVVEQPGAVQNIRIRGINSINSDNGPIYVVNGTIMSASEFSKLDPSTIETVNVIKEAAATSIYGSRAANGAVVVTLKEGLEDYVSVTESPLDVNFNIDMPFDIPSNGKEQTATIGIHEIEAGYKHYSVPRLEKETFLLAEVKGWEKLNLLPGDANILLEGTYVGKSFIDPQSMGQTLNLTLGRDKRVLVKKEKLSDFSSTKFLGSNTIQNFMYEITVRNTKKDSIKMILKDQFPISMNKEIEVELIEDSDASLNQETGVLTWMVTLAPGEERKFRIGYQVKYPKGRVLNL